MNTTKETKILPPLAERMRPTSIKQYIGQKHLFKKGGPMPLVSQNGMTQSIILWGSPGIGKTTLALMLAKASNKKIYTHSAATIGVSEVKKIITQSQDEPAILFLDEIHRFNKSQQDTLLQAIEKGVILLIGATTENPSFEVNKALLSRCHVWTLELLSDDELYLILKQAIEEDSELKSKKIHIKETEALFRYADGDARKLLNALDLLCLNKESNTVLIDNATLSACLQENIARYDKKGEDHYTLISAFIKSVRGSNPDAAVYWLARMLYGGEDILFISRRMIILAAEDIGLANPNALVLANATFDSIHKIGMPEARIILSECAIYLACSEKSNSAYNAIKQAGSYVKNYPQAPVPLHLRNASTTFNKKIGYGKGYQYPHDTAVHTQHYLPEEVRNVTFFTAGSNVREQAMIKNTRTIS